MVEKTFVEAFATLRSRAPDLPLVEYYPLCGSESFSSCSGGMGVAEASAFAAAGLLPEEPDSDILISSGTCREWPDARGLFADADRTLTASINTEEHLRMSLAQPGGNLLGAFERLCQFHDALEEILESRLYRFARSDRLGFLGSCPSNLGTCLAAGVFMNLPLIGARPGFRALCKRLNLSVSLGHFAFAEKSGGHWEILNAERLGSSETQQIETVIAGCQLLSNLEDRVEQGEDVDLAEVEIPDLPRVVSRGQLPETRAPDVRASYPSFGEVPGLGEQDCPGFPTDACPESMPDLLKHHSIAADVLREDPTIYDRLRDLRTSSGTSFARCIKTCVDNPGHPMIKTTGAVAGDAECYNIFAAFFDAVIRPGMGGIQTPNIQLIWIPRRCHLCRSMHRADTLSRSASPCDGISTNYRCQQLLPCSSGSRLSRRCHRCCWVFAGRCRATTCHLEARRLSQAGRTG